MDIHPGKQKIEEHKILVVTLKIWLEIHWKWSIFWNHLMSRTPGNAECIHSAIKWNQRLTVQEFEENLVFLKAVWKTSSHFEYLDYPFFKFFEFIFGKTLHHWSLSICIKSRFGLLWLLAFLNTKLLKDFLNGEKDSTKCIKTVDGVHKKRTL